MQKKLFWESAKMPQIKLNINTSFSINKGAGLAMKYLNSGEIPLRQGIELALSCLFAPLGVAIIGGSIDDVKDRCELSRSLFEAYINLALQRADLKEANSSHEQANSNVKLDAGDNFSESDDTTISSDSRCFSSAEHLNRVESISDTNLNFEQEVF